MQRDNQLIELIFHQKIKCFYKLITHFYLKCDIEPRHCKTQSHQNKFSTKKSKLKHQYALIKSLPNIDIDLTGLTISKKRQKNHLTHHHLFF